MCCPGQPRNAVKTTTRASCATNHYGMCCRSTGYLGCYLMQSGLHKFSAGSTVSYQVLGVKSKPFQDSVSSLHSYLWPVVFQQVRLKLTEGDWLEGPEFKHHQSPSSFSRLFEQDYLEPNLNFWIKIQS